ncbi:MAG TPA: alpha/beta family hydrolase [Actinomycetota bacterium]
MSRRRRFATPSGPVSGLLDDADGPLLIVAHGAGADMISPVLAGFAEGLKAGGVACLRFNFNYREQGRKAPDHERVLRAAWTSVFEKMASDGRSVWVGGKSLGGRIASMVVADGMPAAGLVFLGYPLHPPGKPERIRDAHLPSIRVPMLFIQGTGDPFARRDLLDGVLRKLGERAVLHPVEGGDHSFRVRGRPRDDEATGRRLGSVAARFVRRRG